MNFILAIENIWATIIVFLCFFGLYFVSDWFLSQKFMYAQQEKRVFRYQITQFILQIFIILYVPFCVILNRKESALSTMHTIIFSNQLFGITTHNLITDFYSRITLALLWLVHLGSSYKQYHLLYFLSLCNYLDCFEVLQCETIVEKFGERTAQIVLSIGKYLVTIGQFSIWVHLSYIIWQTKGEWSIYLFLLYFPYYLYQSHLKCQKKKKN